MARKQKAPDPQEVYKAQQEQHEQQEQRAQDPPTRFVIDTTIDTEPDPEGRGTAEKIESLTNAVTRQNEELQRLMHLPISKIKELPQEQQDLVWAEMAREISKTPAFVDAMKSVTEAATDIGKSISEATNRLAQTTDGIRDIFQQLATQFEASIREYRNTIFDLISDDQREAEKIWKDLAPYIDEEQDKEPEKYGAQALAPLNATELLIIAARKAREDGKQIPPLKAEDPRQEKQQPAIFDSKEPEVNAGNITPAGMLETLRSIQAIAPSGHIMPNNALINEMQKKPAINAGAFDLVVSNEQGRRKEITNYTIVSYEPGDSGITITDPQLSEYERQVTDAVISLWVEAKRQNVPPLVTDDMIYQNMPGGGNRPQPAQRAAIARTMQKMRRLHIYMNATEEMRKRGKIGENDTFELDDYYFNFSRGKYKAHNSRQSVTGYLLKEDAPIMLAYSQMTGQLLTVQTKHLAIRKVKAGLISPEIIPATAGRQAMTGYMLRRIAIMRHDEESAMDSKSRYDRKRKQEPGLKERPLAEFRTKSRIMLFDTIFEEAGTVTTSRTQTMENRNFCFDVLEYWKATGLIKDYEEQRKGKKITGFSVTV